MKSEVDDDDDDDDDDVEEEDMSSRSSKSGIMSLDVLAQVAASRLQTDPDADDPDTDDPGSLSKDTSAPKFITKVSGW